MEDPLRGTIGIACSRFFPIQTRSVLLSWRFLPTGEVSVMLPAPYKPPLTVEKTGAPAGSVLTGGAP